MTAAGGFQRLNASQWQVPGGTPAFTSHVVDANNEGVAFIFQAEDANAITGFQYRYGARTGTPPTYVAAIEGVSTSTGAPDGTDVGGGSPTATTFTPPADTTWDGLCQNVTFTNSFTPTKGAIYCVTIRYSSGTIDGSNNSSFNYAVSNPLPGSGICDFPHSATNAAGSWAKRANLPPFMIITGSSRYGYPIESFWSTASASTVGHRHAMKFSLPGTGTTYSVGGFWWTGAISGAAAKSPLLKIWDASSALQSLTLDSDIGGSNATTRYHEYHWATPATLTAGVTYYVGLEVADAVSGQVELEGIQLDAAADGAAYPGGQSNFCLSTYNGSSWTDDETVRPVCGLILETLTEPSGSSGGGYVIGA